VSHLRSHHSIGVVGWPLEGHLVVQVVAAGQAGLAGAADRLAAFDRLPLLDVERRQVAVEGHHAVAVVEDDALP
jgi:hypothetical protein